MRVPLQQVRETKRRCTRRISSSARKARDTHSDCTRNARNLALAHQYAPMVDTVIEALSRR
jgi:hypothetical protein